VDDEPALPEAEDVGRVFAVELPVGDDVKGAGTDEAGQDAPEEEVADRRGRQGMTLGLAEGEEKSGQNGGGDYESE